MTRRNQKTLRGKHSPASIAAQDVAKVDWLPMIRRIEWGAALLLTGAIAYLDVYRVFKQGALWRDEAITLTSATLPTLSDVWGSMVYSRPPILPYVLIRAWFGMKLFGGMDTQWLALSCLLALGLLAAVWAAHLITRSVVPLITMLLFLLNPYVIQWGGSPRGYGLGSLLVLLVFSLIWKVVESPTALWLALAALFTTICVQTLFHAIPLIFAICASGALVCLWNGQRNRAAAVIGVGAVAALSLLPYFKMVRTYQALNEMLSVSLGFMGVLSRFAAIQTGNHLGLFLAWIIFGGVALFFGIWTVLARKRGQSAGRRTFDLTAFSLLVLVLGFAAYLAFLKFSHFSVFAWHCLPLIGILAITIDLLVGAAATTAKRRIVRLVLIVAVAGVALTSSWKAAAVRFSNMDVISSLLAQQASPNDLIVINPWWINSPFRHYYRGKTPWIQVPPMPQDVNSQLFRLDLMKQAMEREDPLRPVFNDMETTLKSGHSVWWVGEFNYSDPGVATPSMPPVRPEDVSTQRVDDYQSGWTLQLGDFVMSHVEDGGPVDLSVSQPVSYFENMMVHRFSIWKP